MNFRGIRLCIAPTSVVIAEFCRADAEFSRLHRVGTIRHAAWPERGAIASRRTTRIFSCREDQIEMKSRYEPPRWCATSGALGFDRVEFKLADLPISISAPKSSGKCPSQLGNAMSRNGDRIRDKSERGRFLPDQDRNLRSDALKRRWQVATIQLDYNNPERFDLTYINSSGASERPVMIIARFSARSSALSRTDRASGGVLPFWLARSRLRVLSLSEKVRRLRERDRDDAEARRYRGILISATKSSDSKCARRNSRSAVYCSLSASAKRPSDPCDKIAARERATRCRSTACSSY